MVGPDRAPSNSRTYVAHGAPDRSIPAETRTRLSRLHHLVGWSARPTVSPAAPESAQSPRANSTTDC